MPSLRAKKTCFVISPIGERNSRIRQRAEYVLNNIVKPSAKRLSIVWTYDLRDPGIVTSEVVRHLLTADLVIADLTGCNPNVFYEFGVRHAFLRPTIQLIEEGGIIPFDVKSVRTIYYDLTDPKPAQEKLAAAIARLNAESPLESPVSIVPEVPQYYRDLTVSPVRGTDIFKAGIDDLKRNKRKTVRIYAPTGLWKSVKVEIKERWFMTIADGLRHHTNGKTNGKPMQLPNVESFAAIYGLPPLRGTSALAITANYCADMVTVRRLLGHFSDCRNAKLFYLDVDPSLVPGTGAILIDDSFALGFAPHTEHQVEYALSFSPWVEPAHELQQWFENHRQRRLPANILLDLDKPTSLDEGLAAAFRTRGFRAIDLVKVQRSRAKLIKEEARKIARELRPLVAQLEERRDDEG